MIIYNNTGGWHYHDHVYGHDAKILVEGMTFCNMMREMFQSSVLPADLCRFLIEDTVRTRKCKKMYRGANW